MTSRDFLSLLEPHAARPLAFLAGGQRVPAGYHVTEIKAHSVRAIDCGGQTSRWSETVLQLIPAGPREDVRDMTVGKFLGIYEKARDTIEPDDNAEIRVEHAAPGQGAVSYLVDSVGLTVDELEVRLSPPGVACKGADRSVGDIPALSRPASGVGAGPVGVGVSRSREGAALATDTGCCSPTATQASGGTCCG